MGFLGKFLGTDLAPGAASVNPLAVILALAATRPIFVADYYVVDGGSGKVRSWIDQSDPTHVLDQSNTARQVALPAAHADFGGALCATFNDTGLYVSNRANAAFAYLTDGTGASSYCTFTPLEAPATANRFIWGTHASVGTDPYMLTLAATGTSNVRVELQNGTTIIYNQAAAISVAPTYLSVHFATARNPDVLYQQKSATVNESDVSGGSPTATAPRGTLSMGANTAFGNLGRFRWRNLMIFPLLDGTGQATVQSYILTDTGIAA